MNQENINEPIKRADGSIPGYEVTEIDVPHIEIGDTLSPESGPDDSHLPEIDPKKPEALH
jgi:hypothetical protein